MAEANAVVDTNTINYEMSQICRGVDKKEDMMLLLTPSYNWSNLLMSAPVTISLLGKLMLISSGNDFSLESKPPVGGFKYIRYPGSFRTSLVQLSNDGWDAFNQAHTSMDQIRLLSGNVDGHVRNAVNILMNGTNHEVEYLVPSALMKIRIIAMKSQTIAEAIEDKFTVIKNLTQEILEACTSTKGVYDEKNQETFISITIAKKEEEARKREKEESRAGMERINKQVSDAENDFKNAISHMPSTAAVLGIAAAESLVDCIRDVVIAVAPVVVPTVMQNFDLTDPFARNSTHVEKSHEDTIDKKLSYCNVHRYIVSIEKHIGALVQIVSGKKDSKNQICPDWEKISNGDALLIEKTIRAAMDNIEEEPESGEIGYMAICLCKEAISICKSLIDKHKELNLTDAEQDNQTLVKRAYKLNDKSKGLYVKSGKMVGKNPLETKSPHLAKMETTSKSQSVLKAVREDAQYKMEFAKETLEDARRRQEKADEESKNTNEKLLKVLKEMLSLNIKEIDFQDIRKTLVKGIEVISAVKAEWGKLVRFFETLANLISCSFATSLSEFEENADFAKKQTIRSFPLSKVFRDIIFEQALKASQIACFVENISSTYVEVSDKHLMDRIASLGKLVALDPVQDIHKITREKKKLEDGCVAAQNAINCIVRKQTQEFNKRIEKRLAMIKEIEAKLPPIKRERLQRIKEITSQAYHDEKSFNEDELSDLV